MCYVIEDEELGGRFDRIFKCSLNVLFISSRSNDINKCYRGQETVTHRLYLACSLFCMSLEPSLKGCKIKKNMQERQYVTCKP